MQSVQYKILESEGNFQAITKDNPGFEKPDLPTVLAVSEADACWTYFQSEEKLNPEMALLKVSQTTPYSITAIQQREGILLPQTLNGNAR